MMTSRILASLEKKSYINREKVDGDARAKLVTLTDKGLKALNISLKSVREVESSFFKPINQSFVDSMDDILSDCESIT
jgi:DNA-binding MarR family transcriptional regulator